MNIQNFSIIASITISLISLFIVIYKEFLQGFKLYSEINDVVLIHTPENNKDQIMSEILLDDFMSDNPSIQASTILDQQPTLAHIAQTRNREKLNVELLNFTNNHPLTYDPPVHFIEAYLKDLRLGILFFIPLVIYNSGKKFAYLSSVVLIAKLNNYTECQVNCKMGTGISSFCANCGQSATKMPSIWATAVSNCSLTVLSYKRA